MAEVRTRRPPPAFRAVEVVAVHDRSPRLRRVTLGGPELADLPPAAPAASVRLLVPRDDDLLELPSWNGNEFLFDDGTRAAIRSLTPLHYDPAAPTLDVDIVLHGDGPMARWAATAEPGAPVGVAGTGRGYDLDPAAGRFVLAGDESALPAIGQLLEVLPEQVVVDVLLEVPEAGRVDLPPHPGATVRWLDPGAELVDAIGAVELGDDARVWAAGEAAAMQRLRRHLFEDRSLPRAQAVIRGYWKVGRATDA